MKNELLDKGIILPSGEIGKDKINLVHRYEQPPPSDSDRRGPMANILIVKDEKAYFGTSLSPVYYAGADRFP